MKCGRIVDITTMLIVDRIPKHIDQYDLSPSSSGITDNILSGIYFRSPPNAMPQSI